MKKIIFLCIIFVCSVCYTDEGNKAYYFNEQQEIFERLDETINKAELRAFLLGKINQLAYEMSFQSAAKYDYRNDPKWNFLKGEMIAYYDILLWTSEIPFEVVD